MGSALETLCGQAYGAGQLEMMGVYMQRSWIILMTTALILTPLYIFAGPFLLLIGQDPTIASAAGKFALLMIPQLYAYSIYFPLTKFLQAQSRVFVMLLIAAGVLLLHTVLSWFVSLKLGWGAPGLAFVLNLSWWCIVVIQYLYILMGSCGVAWSGFSLLAFRNIWSFAKLSIASAIMLW